uniref:Hypothetical secreted protein 850 n=1 Tax=Amblyomma variegatum TaxID=34610 RepID=F0JA89_AMBVA|nr:TPA_inf: hypothetical secreted protein 850 [Amblyomma variegatum]
MMSVNLSGMTGRLPVSLMTVLHLVVVMTTRLTGASAGMKVAMAGMHLRMVVEAMTTCEEDQEGHHPVTATAATAGRTGMVEETIVGMAGMIHHDLTHGPKEMVAMVEMATGVAGMTTATLGVTSLPWGTEEMNRTLPEAEWKLCLCHCHSGQRRICANQMTARLLYFTGRTGITQKWWSDASRTLACRWTSCF